MTQAKSGDTVRLHYTGTLSDGSTFDSSREREPLQFTLGSGEIIPGLDKAIPGMSVGESKRVDVPADDAYGQHDPSAKQEIPREGIPADIPLDPGTRLQMQTPEGQVLPVTSRWPRRRAPPPAPWRSARRRGRRPRAPA